MGPGQFAVFFASQEVDKAKTHFYLNTVKLYWNLYTGEWVIATQFGQKLEGEPEKLFAVQLGPNSASAIIMMKGKKQLQEYRECNFNAMYVNGECQSCTDASFTFGF
jgi:hypothetical protein